MTITVNRDAAEVQAALAGAAKKPPPEASAEQRRTQMAALRAKAKEESREQEHTGPNGADPNVLNMDQMAVEAKGPVPESMKVALPNGMVVDFGPPNGVSMTVKLSDYYGMFDASVGDQRITETMMCVRKIDGKAVSFTNKLGRDKLINMIGDAGFQLLRYAYAKNWPGPQTEDLVILEKNFGAAQ